MFLPGERPQQAGVPTTNGTDNGGGVAHLWEDSGGQPSPDRACGRKLDLIEVMSTTTGGGGEAVRSRSADVASHPHDQADQRP
jgi:hypothetical protein